MESKLAKKTSPCIWCGYGTHLRLNGISACCKEHYDFDRRKKMRKYQGTKTKFICSECGKKYYISARNTIKYRNKCSKKCALISAEKVKKEFTKKQCDLLRAVNNSYRIMSDREKDEFLEEIRRREMER